MPGPLPKDPSERVRRNKPPMHAQVVTLKWDGVQRGPDLPLGLPGIKWSTMTIKWWDTWRNSAQAMLMIDTDWQYMLETALLHNQLWTPKKEAFTGTDGKIKRRAVPRPAAELRGLAGEIRQRLESFGATFRDRQKNGIKIQDQDEFLREQEISQAAQDTVNYFDLLNTKMAEKKKPQ